ncbi:MAG: MBL fold metallo-hydrolase [Pirellulaceae bacterium]|nr:MBL fold metallo-hydrolase [Pirellulaceae bacterium]MDG2104270.1 MBL fold metallo-hydrolase [Pirellulaceae bacterium]
MDIHLLGTAGYHPNETRHTACMMIPEAGVILDAGTGFFRVRDWIQTPELHVFLSHAHLDHCVGLSFYIDVLHEKKVERVFVYGAADKLEAVKTQLFSDQLFPLPPNFEWVTVDPAQGQVGLDLPLDGRITWCPLKHPGTSLGYRLEWKDSNLAYITDTTASASADYIAFIQGTDLLIHECNFADGNEAMAEKTGHSCLTPVAEVCAAADVDRCVIVHFNPMGNPEKELDLASVKPIYQSLIIGQDHMRLTF